MYGLGGWDVNGHVPEWMEKGKSSATSISGPQLVSVRNAPQG